METWLKVSCLLCVFGFLKEFRPSEPYITPYLMGPLNFTEAQVSQDIYPISTYANMLSLIAVFLLTDILRYKAVIIADALSGFSVYCGLILFQSLFAVQVVEVLYGLFMSGDVAYYSYIYAKVEPEHFQEVSSHTRSAYLAGRAFSGIVSQTIVYFGLLSYYHLHYLSLLGLLCASLWSLTLPPVKHSIYFNQKTEVIDTADNDRSCEPISESVSKVSYYYEVKHLWTDLSAALSNVYVVKWGFWWALATCGYWQILNYIQVLWQVTRKETNNNDPPLYGIVETAYTLLGAMASMAMGRMHIDWAQLGEPVLVLCSVTIAAVLFLLAHAQSIVLSYFGYIGYTVIYNAMITVANSEIAKNINKDSYGLIFGVATFFALVLQTGLTFIVNDIFQLSARAQFVVYAAYFGILGMCFLISFLLKKFFRLNRYTVSEKII